MDSRRIVALRRSVSAAWKAKSPRARWLIGAVGIISVLLMMIVLLPLIVPQATVDRLVKQQISRRTGMQADWRALHWHLLPTLKVVVKDVRLFNPDFSGQSSSSDEGPLPAAMPEPVMSAGRLDIGLRYSELLLGHVVVDQVNVRQARVLVARRGCHVSWLGTSIPLCQSVASKLDSTAADPWFSRRFMTQIVDRVPEVSIDQLDVDFQLPHFRQQVRTDVHLTRQNGLHLKARLVARPESNERIESSRLPHFSLTADWHPAAHGLQVMARARAIGMHDALFRFDGYFDPANPRQASGAMTLDVPDPGRLWHLGDTQQFRSMAPQSMAASFIPGQPVRSQDDVANAAAGEATVAPLFESDHLSVQIGSQVINARAALWPHLASSVTTPNSRPDDERPVLKMELGLGHFDWPQLRNDLGLPPPPPKPTGELLSDQPYKWEWLLAQPGVDIEAHLGADTLRLYQNVVLGDPRFHVLIDSGQMVVPEFSFVLADGAVAGHALLTGSSKTAVVTLHGRNISLEKWRSQLGKSELFSGGAMDIDAQVSASGASLKNLAASLHGPVRMKVHETTVFNPKAAHAENMFSDFFPMLVGHGEKQLQLSCVSARLWFDNGVASMAPAVGVRSLHTQLVGKGTVDLKRQMLDLQGRLLPLSARDIGLGNVLGNIRMHGPLNHPRIGLDPTANGLAQNVLRAGAAALTFGLSAAAVHAADLQQPDACMLVRDMPINSTDHASETAGNDAKPSAASTDNRSSAEAKQGTRALPEPQLSSPQSGGGQIGERAIQ